MSTKTVSPATLNQGKQTLNLIGQQEPSVEDMNTLHTGYLTYLMQAIKQGVVPPHEQFHELIGLGPLFKTDKYGRTLITVTGRGWTHEEWFATGYEFSDWGRDTLNQPDYDEKHRLEPGKQYTVALVLGKEIKKDAERSTGSLRKLAERDYGKSPDLKGELALLIREAISYEQMGRFGVEYIAILHEPIIGSGGDPLVLFSDRYDRRLVVDAGWGDPDDIWVVRGAFAFPVSQ